MKSARTTIVAVALLLSGDAVAQDVRGLEVCTAEKEMTRRTSCLQANIEFLQRELTRQMRRTQDDRAAAARELTALKADITALKATLAKAQNEIVELKKKPDKK